MLDKQLRESLRSREEKLTRRRLTNYEPQNLIDFSSNDYLSFTKNSILQQTLLNQIVKNPHMLAGSGGSRLLDGNTLSHEALEKRLAAFHNGPTALLFNSGFDANAGMFSCLPQPGDTIIYDEFIHASVHDGMRLSRVPKHQQFSFTHNDIRSLEEILLREANGKGNIFVAIESLYSMDGDVSPLVEIVDTCKQYPRVYLILDEAHGTGVYGSEGKGLANALGLEQDIFIRLHTFGKAIASNGAIVICNETVREYLINYARPLIFSTSLAASTLLSISCAYDILESGRQFEDIQGRLHVLCKYLHQRLASLPRTTLITLPSPIGYKNLSPSPIVPILTTRPRILAKYLVQRGYLVRPITFPTVPKGGERVRVCLHASNTKAQVDALISAISEWILSTQCIAPDPPCQAKL